MDTPYKTEREMYEPVRQWLRKYLNSHFKEAEVHLYEGAPTKLCNMIDLLDVSNDIPADWLSWQMVVDVVASIRTLNEVFLVLVECKNDALSIEDYAKFYGYAHIVKPRLAFLVSPQGIKSSLATLLKVYQRLDILEYTHEPDRASRALVLARWDANANAIDFASLITTDSQKVELNKVHR